MNNMSTQALPARCALHARQWSDQLAVICEGREVTYAQLHRRSNQTAHALLSEGLRRGVRVAYLGRESEHYFDIALGCAKSGTVLVPINWRLTSREIDHVSRDSGAELLFIEHDFRSTADRLRSDLPSLRVVIEMDMPGSRADGFLCWRVGHPDSDLDPCTGREDAVVQMYTSGTTGLPKGVVLANRTFFTLSVGVPDQRWGQAVKAVIVLRPGKQATARDFMVFLRGRLADFKIPTRRDFVESLPRNPTGKILRRLLKAKA